MIIIIVIIVTIAVIIIVVLIVVVIMIVIVRHLHLGFGLGLGLGLGLLFIRFRVLNILAGKKYFIRRFNPYVVIYLRIHHHHIITCSKAVKVTSPIPRLKRYC
jgi:hypothetical protein